jgi:hypothetical protein
MSDTIRLVPAPATPAAQVRLEDLARDFDCVLEHRMVGVDKLHHDVAKPTTLGGELRLRWCVRGAASDVRDLLEEMNDQGMLDVVGVGADPFLELEDGLGTRCVLSQFAESNKDTPDVVEQVRALKPGEHVDLDQGPGPLLRVRRLL